jgi:hypothetical protein
MSNDSKQLDFLEEARKDLEFDITNVDRLSLRIPLLQEKYARMVMFQKAEVKKAEYRLKEVEAERHEFYMTQYSYKVDRRDVDKYIWGDEKYINANKVLDGHKIKLEYLQTIMGALDKASWNINNFVKLHIWKNGGG